MSICQRCGTGVPDGVPLCPRCGASVTMQQYGVQHQQQFGSPQQPPYGAQSGFGGPQQFGSQQFGPQQFGPQQQPPYGAQPGFGGPQQFGPQQQPPYGAQSGFGGSQQFGAPPPPPKNKNMMMIIITAGVVVLAGVVCLILWLTGALSSGSGRDAPTEPTATRNTSRDREQGDRDDDNDDDDDVVVSTTPTPRQPTSSPSATPESADPTETPSITPATPSPSATPSPTPTPSPSPTPSPTPTSSPQESPGGGQSGSVIPEGGGSLRIDGDTSCSFRPNQSGVWEFRTSDSGESDPMVTVLDSRGNSIITDDDGAGTLDALCYATLNAGETYTVVVVFWEYTGYFYTTLNVRLSEGGSSTGSPPPTTTPTPGAAAGTFPSSGGSLQVNGASSFTITPQTGGVWFFFTSDNGSSDPVLALYDASGNNINGNDDDGGDRNACMLSPLTPGATYRVDVTFNGGNAGACSVTAVAPTVITETGGTVRLTTPGSVVIMPSRSTSFEIRIENNGSTDKLYAIFDDHFNLIVNDNDAGGDRYTAIHQYTINPGDPYHIVLRYLNSVRGDCTITVAPR